MDDKQKEEVIALIKEIYNQEKTNNKEVENTTSKLDVNDIKNVVENAIIENNKIIFTEMNKYLYNNNNDTPKENIEDKEKPIQKSSDF